MKNLLPVLMIFVLLALGCASFETIESTKVTPSEISQNYRISLSQNRTNVVATFYANRATVDLDAPSRIELNGQEMRERSPSFLKGTDYHYASDYFEPKFQFAFYAANGRIYRNEANLEPLEIVGQDLSLSRSGQTKFRLSRAVAPDESVSFSLRSKNIRVVSNDANNFNADVERAERFSADADVVLDKSRTSFTIDPVQLERFTLGEASLEIEVWKNPGIQQSTDSGGYIHISYKSQTAGLKIVQ